MNKPLFPEVTVNGVTIASAEISAEAQNHPAPRGKPGLAWQSAARALVLRRLLLQEAARRGVHPEPAEVAPGRFETTEEAMIRAVTEAAISVVRPTEEEVQAVWSRDPKRFMSQPLWEVSHILVTGEDAKARAEKMATDLASNPNLFSKLVRDNSDCPSAANGGALGQLSPGGAVPEFEAAIAKLSEGQITSHPVETRFGWHIIRMDSLAPGRPLPFEAVRPKLAEAIEKVRWARAARQLADRLIASAEITGIDLHSARRGRA